MKKILLAGRLDLGPLARHIRAFIETLAQDDNNKIFIDPFYIDFYRCDSFGTKKLLDEYLQYKNVWMASPYQKYDIGIFTDLLTLQYGDGIYKHFLTYDCGIKICYEVFDGSLPPSDWINIINSNFDICCAPSVYIADRLKASGVTIPCFNLPCVVFNDELLQLTPTINNTTYRFGFIGGAEQRKNAVKVIKAFHQAFDGVPDVELYLHCSYSPEPEYVAECFSLVQEYSKTQKITFKFQQRISKEEMYKLIASFNFYIFPTKNTGYFTTPCEALSVGIPIIVSDIPVHQELVQSLTEKDGAFLIKADEVDIMIHSYLGNKCLGVQYDMSVAEIAKQMKKAYSLRKQLFSKVQVEKRKSVASQYSLASLTKTFLALAHPKEFVLSKIEGIEGETLFCHSQAVYSKYKTLYKNLPFITDSKRKLTKFSFYINKPEQTALIEKICPKIEKEHVRPLSASAPVGPAILYSTWMKKMIARAEQYKITRMPRFVYKIFSQYCKTKKLFSKEK